MKNAKASISKGEAMPKNKLKSFHKCQVSKAQAKALKGGTDFIITDDLIDN